MDTGGTRASFAPIRIPHMCSGLWHRRAGSTQMLQDADGRDKLHVLFRGHEGAQRDGGRRAVRRAAHRLRDSAGAADAHDSPWLHGWRLCLAVCLSACCTDPCTAAQRNAGATLLAARPHNRSAHAQIRKWKKLQFKCMRTRGFSWVNVPSSECAWWWPVAWMASRGWPAAPRRDARPFRR
jgi:hypothetical protein